LAWLLEILGLRPAFFVVVFFVFGFDFRAGERLPRLVVFLVVFLGI
tara:strand:- start:1747 stop:1884 length:138 start_codon:yes stop_codon:yes gene_type:complete